MAKKVNLTKKSEITVTLYLDISDEDNIKVLSDEDFLKLKESNPTPETIFEFKSIWAKPNFGLQQLIEANSYVEKIIAGKVQRFFDPNAMSISQIRVLLRSWNLDQLDEKMVLKFANSIDSPNTKLLNDETIKVIIDMPTNIVSVLYEKAFASLYLEPPKAKSIETTI